MLLDAGKAAVHRAHDAEQAIERLRVLAQRGRVLVSDHFTVLSQTRLMSPISARISRSCSRIKFVGSSTIIRR